MYAGINTPKMLLSVILVKYDSRDIVPKNLRLLSIHVSPDNLIKNVKKYSIIGTISHEHFHTPMVTEITMLTRLNSSTCDAVICLPFLQLHPIAIPIIKQGTRLNAHCILYKILDEE